MSTTNNHICPILGCNCTQHGSLNLLRDHLLLNHTRSLGNISEAEWDNMGIYKCPDCHDQLFTNKGALTRHINRIHKVGKSQVDNVERISQFIPTPPTSTHQWNKALVWLDQLTIQPPSFRQSIWLKTNKTTKTKIKHLFNRLILTVVNSPNRVDIRPTVPALHRIDVLWKLLILFESLILYPLDKNSSHGTSTQLDNRIYLFKIGDIKTLYEKSRTVKSRSPEEKQANAINSDNFILSKCAQTAADNDQFKSAIQRITNNTPVALNTPETIEILQNLYPSKHEIGYLDKIKQQFLVTVKL